MINVNVKVNFDAIANFIGAVEGINKETSSMNYQKGLLNNAHNTASLAFDREIASSASAGFLTHVFEFNVAHVTRGNNTIGDPTSPAARLYEHVGVISAGQMDVNFVFRPAVQPNPKPTEESTGVSSIYLSKLSKKKYVFRQKASVMESGESVEIKSRSGNKLFVPFYGAPPRTADNQRGFLMYPFSDIVANPGRASKGTFRKFWRGWWSTDGSALMDKKMSGDYDKDVTRAMRYAQASTGAMVSPGSYSMGRVTATTANRVIGGMKQATANRQRVRT